VKKGDNPSRFAKKFKVSPQDIMRANDLKPHDLRPGDKITIPSPISSHTKESTSKNKIAKVRAGGHAKGKTAKHAPNDDAAAAHQNGALVHIVKKGDTLLSVAKKYSVSVGQLREMNNLRTKRIKVGRRLVVKQATPESYRVKKGDTVWNIARKFDLDPDELAEINDLETESLKPGQKILLAAEPQVAEPKTYEAVLSQAHIEKEIENIAGSEEIGKLGLRDRLTLFAKKLLDIPYRFGGNSVLGIDCSAYVKKVYSLIGMDLPRSAREQFQEGKSVDGDDLSIGDLVFFKTYASFPSHVGIYLGNNLFIHASSKSRKVTINSLDTPYYLKRFIGAKRILDVKEVIEDPEKKG
jgi:cell wall-associated NlpC family hydrolase